MIKDNQADKQNNLDDQINGQTDELNNDQDDDEELLQEILGKGKKERIFDPKHRNLALAMEDAMQNQQNLPNKLNSDRKSKSLEDYYDEDAKKMAEEAKVKIRQSIKHQSHHELIKENALRVKKFIHKQPFHYQNPNQKFS
ncbi:MAG: hypothetical protein EZS28_036007 [Streblomastix strix]|uniref:Uncharacterized protein n=1 Tax=Streblomastix strix TaxID=222440 RepID=A0A5J4UCD8_9EUKA|nr:MAG: hypothetical protein EZS28_036007 [Streblomastix strix]